MVDVAEVGLGKVTHAFKKLDLFELNYTDYIFFELDQNEKVHVTPKKSDTFENPR